MDSQVRFQLVFSSSPCFPSSLLYFFAEKQFRNRLIVEVPEEASRAPGQGWTENSCITPSSPPFQPTPVVKYPDAGYGGGWCLVNNDAQMQGRRGLETEGWQNLIFHFLLLQSFFSWEKIQDPFDKEAVNYLWKQSAYKTKCSAVIGAQSELFRRES